MSMQPRLDELIWLFESEPSVEYDDLGYPTSATTFVTTRGSAEVECTIEPYMNSLTIRLCEGGEERLRLHLWGLVDRVAVDRLHGQEALVAAMVPGAGFQELRLQMRPSPSVSWASEAPWAPGARL